MCFVIVFLNFQVPAVHTPQDVLHNTNRLRRLHLHHLGCPLSLPDDTRRNGPIQRVATGTQKVRQELPVYPKTVLKVLVFDYHILISVLILLLLLLVFMATDQSHARKSCGPESQMPCSRQHQYDHSLA